MKILITGCTSTHVNDADRVSTVKFISTPELLAKKLTAMGHEVVHGLPPVEIADFDRVVCFLYPKDKNAKYAMDAVRVLQERKDAIVGVDDWACYRIIDTWKHLIPRLEDRLWIAPMFRWGNPGKLGIKAEVMGFDLSPMVKYVAPVYQTPRTKAWFHASYHKDSHFWASKHCSWNVLSYGCRELGQEQILETTSSKMYGTVEGVLCPPYNAHVGSGWWRPRILQAAYAEAVLGADPREMGQLGVAYSQTVKTIEGLLPKQIRMLASAQATAVFNSIGTSADLERSINSILEQS